MSSRAESLLLLVARVLVLILPRLFIGGRVAVDVALSLTVVLFVVRSVFAHDWAWTRSAWFRIGVALWLWMLFIGLFAFVCWLLFCLVVLLLRFLFFVVAF